MRNDKILQICLLILLLFFQEFECNLLTQASRIQEIRSEYNHQELRSLVNQTSDHVQRLFTTSNVYSDK